METRLGFDLASGTGTKEGRDGESAAGEVFERWRVTCRVLGGEDSVGTCKEGVVGNSEKPGLLLGWGEVALRGMNCLSLSRNSFSYHVLLEPFIRRSPVDMRAHLCSKTFIDSLELVKCSLPSCK